MDVLQDVRVGEAGHGAHAPVAQLLQEHDAAQAAEDLHVGIGREHLAGLARRRFLFQLEKTALRGPVGDGRDEIDAHQDAAAGGVVLDHERYRYGVGYLEIVGKQGLVRALGQLRRRHHERRGAQLLGPPAQRCAPIRPGMAGSGADRDPSRRGFDHTGNNLVPFGFDQLAGFAHDAQYGDPVYPQVDEEISQGRQAARVQAAVFFKGRRRDRIYALGVLVCHA